jgi:peptidoglycan hydrolase CwlO-like protein
MPPASSNDSQGLKIAVAAFVSLTVILAVTAYFLYSNYSTTFEKLTAAETKAQTSQKAASDALLQYDELRKRIGSRAEEFDPAKAEIKAEQDKVDADINSLIGQVNDAINKLTAAGATGPELEDAKAKVGQISSAYMTEPNKNYISSMSRLKDLLKSLVLLDLEVARDYAALKKNLESTNSVNQSKLEVATKGFSDAKTDLQNEHTSHEQKRDELLTKVDQYQTEIARQATEIASLNTKYRQLEEDSSKKLRLAQDTLREMRDQVERKETVLDSPDGYITYYDPQRGEVRTNLTHRMGVRPQMSFTIFDRNAPGIPTDKPKGTIELTYVTDSYSIGRVVKTFNPIDPLRTGDIVYSPAWSPNEPMRFALIGKMDVNRDGKDDRADLKRMIEAAGGIVDYDLPPPEAGKESGQLTGRDAWYVFDDRIPFVLEFATGKSGVSGEQFEFLKKQSEAIKEARINGVRPMAIGRLLSYLGYDYHAPVTGRAEAVDTNALRRLLAPKQREQPKPAPEATPSAEGVPAPTPGAMPENP